MDVPFNAQNNGVYGMDKKDKIPGNRLFHHANKQSEKIMVSACVTWKGATKPFFVNENGLKVNAKTYKKHLEKQLFPEVDRLMKVHLGFFFKIAPHLIARILFKIS